MAVLGATAPKIEELLLGRPPGLPPLTFTHTAIAFESGADYLNRLEHAASGQLSPFVLVVEGSIFDPTRAGEGFFSGLGEADGRPIPITAWLDRLAPHAMAVIAIGTCATWGGVPAARGNPTGAMGLTDYLGADFRSMAGLPVVNLPGCAPPGDNFTETLVYLLLHLEEQVPLELDEQRRPRWLYAETTRVTSDEWRVAGQYSSYVVRHPSPDTLVACRVPARGWMNRVGGCGNVGGACNGCTMPGFPDQYLPTHVLQKSSD
ncbi:MAG: hydrogenase expression protein HypE [Chloroflexi bacterium]|nr:hydrogenase expression protein HypE [Chloroflexota bacterium]